MTNLDDNPGNHVNWAPTIGNNHYEYEYLMKRKIDTHDLTEHHVETEKETEAPLLKRLNLHVEKRVELLWKLM